MPTTPATQARLIADAAIMLAKRLDATGGKYDRTAQRNLFDLCNATIGLIDDGDCMAQRDILMDELRCDEGGNPVDEDGPLDFTPRNMVPSFATLAAYQATKP